MHFHEDQARKQQKRDLQSGQSRVLLEQELWKLVELVSVQTSERKRETHTHAFTHCGNTHQQTDDSLEHLTSLTGELDALN